MTTKKNSNTTTNVKDNTKRNEKKEKSNLEKALILQKSIKLANEDKMLKKVEKYVDKNREKTSQEIMERKSKRPIKKFQEGDLDVLISRVSIESKPKDRTKKTSKLILYIIYTIIIIAILTFIIKFFFTGNMPQNG